MLCTLVFRVLAYEQQAGDVVSSFRVTPRNENQCRKSTTRTLAMQTCTRVTALSWGRGETVALNSLSTTLKEGRSHAAVPIDDAFFTLQTKSKDTLQSVHPRFEKRNTILPHYMLQAVVSFLRTFPQHITLFNKYQFLSRLPPSHHTCLASFS